MSPLQFLAGPKGPSGARMAESARALWAVRVLDAWASTYAGLSWDSTPTAEDWFMCRLWKGGAIEEAKGAETIDAARLAAAEAVWPELPESVRAEIGGAL